MRASEFKVGDRVSGCCLNGKTFKGKVIKIKDQALQVERDDNHGGSGDYYNGRPLWRCLENNGIVKSDGRDGEPLKLAEHTITGGNKMELGKIKKENLNLAKKQFNEDKRNAEIDFAKAELRRATDELNRLDRDIKAIEARKEPYLKILENFK